MENLNEPNAEGLETFPSPTIGKDGKPVTGAGAGDAPPATSAENKDASAELWPEGHPAATTGKPPEVPPKKDESRFQYWQSQADVWKKKAEENERLAEIGRLLIENKSSSAAPVTSAPPVTPEEKDSLSVPKRPEKPAEYDEVEAYNDPKSASFRYRKSVEAYRDDLLDYYAKKEEARDRRQREETDRHEREEILKKQLSAVQVELQHKYNFTPAEAIEFIQVMTSGESVTLDNLVSLFRVKKSGDKPQRNITAELEERRRRGDNPPPGAVGGGETSVEPDPETAFNQGLLQYSKVRRNK